MNAYAQIPEWAIWTALIVGIVYLAAVTIGSVVGALAHAAYRRERDARAQQASDHDEPVREDVELAYDDDTPIFDQLAADHPGGDVAAQHEAREVYDEDRLSRWQEHCRTAFEHAMSDRQDFDAWERECTHG